MDELIRILKTQAISTKSKRRIKQIMSANLLIIDEVAQLSVVDRSGHSQYRIPSQGLA
jgi:DNA replication protein DnaC